MRLPIRRIQPLLHDTRGIDATQSPAAAPNGISNTNFFRAHAPHPCFPKNGFVDGTTTSISTYNPGAIVMLFLYPLLNTSILRSGNFRPIYAVVFLLFVADFCLLGWAGTTPVDDYFRFIGVFVSVGYFAFFLFGGLFVGWLEKKIMLQSPHRSRRRRPSVRSPSQRAPW